VSEYSPERGDAVWLDFNPQSGREQAGRRPAFVISPRSYNQKVRLFVACPITTKRKGYPFEVVIPEELKVSGVILCDQLKSLDWRERRAELICPLPEDVTVRVLQRVKALLNL